ncbi:MAG: PucR family transcriptional regulator ligand-binding domain-containing protein [Vulcanimicrobiaceae bacterium]
MHNYPSMILKDVLALPSLSEAAVVAGGGGLTREVLWSHVVDVPDPAPWVRPGHLILTTGFSWPKTGSAQQAQIRDLAQAGVVAIALAVPRFVARFSDEARLQAERSNLPLIEIPFDIPFAQIMEELHRAIMAAPYRLIERSEHIHRELTRAATQDASLDELAASLAALISRSVTFESHQGKLLAHSPAHKGHAPAQSAARTVVDRPASISEYGDRAGVAQQIRYSVGPVRMAADAIRGMSARVVCPIRVGADLAGMVWIVEGDEPLSELDHRAAEHASLVAAMQIAHQRELETLEARLGYASLLSLFESEPGLSRGAEERMRILGFDPAAMYRAGIVVIPEELPLGREGVLRRDAVILKVREALEAQGVEQLVTAYLNHVPFLLPDAVDARIVLKALDDPALSITLGRSHNGADGARASYREALSLLSYRYRGELCSYEDLLVPRVIMGDTKAREDFLAELFAPLRERKNGGALAAAVLALARSGFQFRVTAESLDIHPNTLRYRLDRATESLGIDLGDPDVQFRLQLAARLLDIENRPW